MPAAAGAVPTGGFRTAYEFRKWIMRGGDNKSPNRMKNPSASIAPTDDMAANFVYGLSQSLAQELKKLIDGYDKREIALKKQLQAAKKAKADKREQAEKKRAAEAKKESEDIMNMLAAHGFEKGRAGFNKKVMAQYHLMKGFKPKAGQEQAYQVMFQKIAELTAYTRKKDISGKDLKDIKKLEGDIKKMTVLFGPSIQKRLEKIEQGSSAADKKWFRTWDDYKSDMAKFRDNVLGGISGLGKRMLAGFANIGIGPVTIGNITKLIAGSIKGAGWVGGAALTGLGAAARGLGLGRGAAWLGKKALQGTRAIGSKVGTGIQEGFQNAGGGDAIKRLTDTIGGYVRSTKNYREKMLGNFKKQLDQLKMFQRLKKWGAAAGGVGGNILGMLGKLFKPGFLGGLIGSLTGPLIKGIMAAVGGLAMAGGKLLGRIGAILGRFLLGPAGLILGAGAAGAAIGTALYKAFDTQILDGIDWIVESFHKTIEWFSEKWTWLKDKINAGKEIVKTGIKKARDFIFGGGDNKPLGQTSDADMGGTGAPESSPLPDTGNATPVPTPATTSDKTSQMMGGQQADTRKEDDRQVAAFVKKLRGDVDVRGLNPQVRENFINMAKDYYEATGKKLQVNSGKRSSEEQARLYKTLPKGMAAAPGMSLHELGYALDLQSSQAGELEKMGLLKKHGFMRPLSNKGEKSEGWHITPEGMPNVYALNQGATVAKPASSTTAVNEGFSPEPRQHTDGTTQVAEAPAQAPKKGGAVGASQRVGTNDVPTFSGVDQTLLALNLGAFGGA